MVAVVAAAVGVVGAGDGVVAAAVVAGAGERCVVGVTAGVVVGIAGDGVDIDGSGSDHEVEPVA